MFETIEPCQNSVTEVNSDHAPATRFQSAEVAESLRLLEHTERVGFTGYAKISTILRAELEEDAAAWSTLVKLSGRMQETRTVAGGCGAVGRVAQVSSEVLEFSIEFRCLFGVVEKRDVVAGFDGREL